MIQQLTDASENPDKVIHRAEMNVTTDENGEDSANKIERMSKELSERMNVMLSNEFDKLSIKMSTKLANECKEIEKQITSRKAKKINANPFKSTHVHKPNTTVTFDSLPVTQIKHRILLHSK